MLCVGSIQKSGFVVLISVLVGWVVFYCVMLSKGLRRNSTITHVVEIPYYSQIMSFLRTGGRNR